MGSPGPVSGGSGPQRTFWDNGFINAIKTTLNKVAEFMGDVALTLRLPLVGPWVSDYRARRDFVAQLPDGMAEDQAKTADTTQQAVNRTLPFGQPVESSQNAPVAKQATREEIEKDIEKLKQEIEDLYTEIYENVKSMNDNLRLELKETDKAIPGLNDNLRIKNFHLQSQIKSVAKKIAELQSLYPDLQLKSMKETISEIVNINELQTLLRELQKGDWPNRNLLLDSVEAAIGARINEIEAESSQNAPEAEQATREEIESSQNAPEAKQLTREETEEYIETLNNMLGSLYANRHKIEESIANNTLEGTGEVIPGLNSKLSHEIDMIDADIIKANFIIADLQTLYPDLQLKAMEENISKIDDIDELERLSREFEEGNEPNRDLLLDSVKAAIENRINEIERDNSGSS